MSALWQARAAALFTDPIGGLVQRLARPCNARALAGFRVCAAAALGLHFVDQLRHSRPLITAPTGLPELVSGPYSGPALGALWLLALPACAGLCWSRLARPAALVLLLIAVTGCRALDALACLDDFVAVWLAAWLLVSPAAPGAACGVSMLLLVSTGLLYVDRPIWTSNLPGWNAPVAVHTALALAPCLSVLFGRAAWGAAALYVSGHVWLWLNGSWAWSNLALLSVTPLLFHARLDAVAPADARERRAPAFELTTSLAFVYVVLMLLSSSVAARWSRVRGASERVLKLAELLPPRSASELGVAPDAPALRAVDARERPLGAVVIGGDLRARVLATYLTDRPWKPAHTRGRQLTQKLRQHAANQLCANARAADVSIVDASLPPNDARRRLLHLACDERARTARILPLSGYAGPLATASEPGFSAPGTIPAWFDRSAFVGSPGCASCHAAVHADWRASPHATTLAAADPERVRGDFKHQWIRQGPRSIELGREHGQAFMSLDGNRQQSVSRVRYVLGAGRDWQAYISDDSDGMRLLPLAWSLGRARWQLVADLYREIYDPQHPKLNQFLRLETAGCLSCHATEPHVLASDSGARYGWIEPGVGCEACHGPGGEHVRQRSGAAGAAPDPYAWRAADGTTAAERRCANCHAPNDAYAVQRAHGWLDRSSDGLADRHVGATGLPERREYQLPAFALSRCHVEGGATCSTCHAVHAHDERSDMPSAARNRACMGCHVGLAAASAQRAHSRHPTAIACIDCHMPRPWLRDDPELGLRVTDHSISIPRPLQAERIGTQSACTLCHEGWSEGWAQQTLADQGAATATREAAWVVHIHGLKQARYGSKYGLAIEALAATLGTSAAREQPLVGMLQLLPRLSAAPGLLGPLRRLADDERFAVRAGALAALIRHDPEHAERWLEQGAADPDPLVRIASLRASLDRRIMSEHAQRQYLHDLMRHATRPPIAELVRLANLREVHDEPVEALALLDLAARYALPEQQARFHAQRERLRGALAPR